MKRFIFISLSLLVIVACILLAVRYKEDKTDKEDYLTNISLEANEKYGDVYIADDENIISLYDYHGKDAFLKNFSAVTLLGEKCELPVYVAIPPRKMDALTNSLPTDYPAEPAEYLFELSERECDAAGISYIDLYSTLKGKGNGTGDIYFATDHHWTSHGAYLAYREIIKAFGITPLNEDYFDVKTAHTAYRGSDYNKTEKSEEYTCFDTIRLYYSPDYDSFKVTSVSYPYGTDENNLSLEGMYCMSYLESSDPYTVYFTGNVPYITIRKKDVKRDTLLIIRDSFASAVTPFLAEHFDVVLIDPRFFPDKISTVAERESAVAILVLENMASFTEHTVKFLY